MTGKGKATENDCAIGARLRAARVAVGLSQEELAAAVGISFQQVQKYETGRNRIAGSRLEDLAKVLNVPVAYFFSQEAVAECALLDANRELRGRLEAIHRLSAVNVTSAGGEVAGPV